MASTPCYLFYSPLSIIFPMSNYLGIDVSKDKLDVASLSAQNSWKVSQFSNSPEGIRTLIASLPTQAHCVIEATGSYSVLVSYMLTQARVTISVINPRQSHHFAQMQLSITKTDSRDAVILAEYGRVMQPPVYQFSKDSLLALRQKRALLRQYQKQRVMLTNLQESFSPLPYQDATTQLSLVGMIGHFENAIAQIKGEINQLCKEDFEEQLRRLTSIKGISDTIATALIETTNGFQDFHSAKALAKYIGLAPVTYQSGKASQSRGINRTGDPHLRGMLYMATWSAIRFNKPCQVFYQRLRAAGKPGKVALIAVANKLIRQAFAVVKYGEDFNPDYQPVLRSLT